VSNNTKIIHAKPTISICRLRARPRTVAIRRAGFQGRARRAVRNTNNKLTPVDGFNVSADHLKKYDVLSLSVGTDPALALKTRRGTGYYKVPSLKGVWYRGPLEHSGSVATLEDWFDPRRLRDDYAPTGFRGAGVKTRAVKGHAYGLNLSAADRRALIAFLKTL
jgi:hypothetical protein